MAIARPLEGNFDQFVDGFRQGCGGAPRPKVLNPGSHIVLPRPGDLRARAAIRDIVSILPRVRRQVHSPKANPGPLKITPSARLALPDSSEPTVGLLAQEHRLRLKRPKIVSYNILI